MADTVADDPFSRLMAAVPAESGGATASPAPAASPEDDPFSRLMATVGTETPKTASVPPVEGNSSAMQAQLQREGYQPTAFDRALTDFNDFTGQAQRSASFGLTDKVAAVSKAAENALYRAITGDTSVPDFSDTYHNELLKQRGYGETYAQNHPVASPIATTLGTVGSLGADTAAALPTTLAGKIGQGAATGAGVGALSGFGNSNDQSLRQTLKDTAIGAGTGAVTGATVPLAFKGGGMAINALTGGGVDPATARLAETAMHKYDIPVRGGQISSSPFVKYADSVLQDFPLSGYGPKAEKASEAFTRAVSHTFGEDSPSLTQDVMQKAKTRIGKMFDDVAGKTTIQADNQLLGDLAKVESEASQVLPGSEMKPIKNQLGNIVGKVTPQGTIEGDAYQALTRKGSPLDRAMSSSDPNVRFYAGQVRNALDDALERSAPSDVLNQLQGARFQYKNMKTVEDLAEKAGPSGQISPPLLLSQVRKSFPNYAYTGAGDLGELAQIGQRFLKEPPNSGTASRSLIHRLLALAGGEGAAYLYDPHLAAAGAAGLAGTLGAGRVLGVALDNPLYRASLLRSAVAPGAISRAVGDPLFPQAVAAYLPAVLQSNRLSNAPSPVGP